MRQTQTIKITGKINVIPNLKEQDAQVFNTCHRKGLYDVFGVSPSPLIFKNGIKI